MTAMTFELNAIAEASALRGFGYTVVDCLLEGTFIALFAGAILRVFPRRQSGARFAVWFSALVAIAVLPLSVAAWPPHAGNISAEAVSRSAISVPGSWATYFFAAWAAIAAWQLIGVGRSLWHLYVLRRSCVAVDLREIDWQLRQTLARNQSPRAIALCTSQRVHVPTAIGLIKPAVVLPRWVMRELSAAELNQILLHELAHLRRWDDWTNLAQKIVKAFFFFHPAVWWLERRVSLEREMACDEAVLAETASPRAYAECLAHLAEKTFVQRSVVLAQAALGKIRQTSLRVARILDVNRAPETGRAWKPVVALVAVFAVVCGVGVSRAPRLIAFDDGTSRPTAARVAAPAPEDLTGQASTAMSVAAISASRAKSEIPARIVPAKFIVPQPSQHPLRKSSHAVAKDSLKAQTSPALRASNAAQDALPASVPPANAAEVNVRLTNSDLAPAYTETLFVVIEGGENGSLEQPVLQIQLWRIVVFHPVVNPDGNRIPAKQT